MAVNLTYARAHSHDRPYFNDPLKLLSGVIEPPAFNLRNDVMVRKHVHAVVITELHGLARPVSAIGPSDRTEIHEALTQSFPSRVREYLFESSGEVRRQPFEMGQLRVVLAKHIDRLQSSVLEVFEQGWPADDYSVVQVGALRVHIEEMDKQLEMILDRLKLRLDWAIDQMNRLDQIRRVQGTLDPDQDALRNRCDRYMKRLKGTDPRRRSNAEGFDDTNTYSVLAAEGFLPGYGLDSGWVVGMYEAPRFNPSPG